MSKPNAAEHDADQIDAETNAPTSDTEEGQRPKLLPKNFLAGQRTPRGKRVTHAVDVAQTERREPRQQRLARRAERDQQRQRRLTRDKRVLVLDKAASRLGIAAVVAAPLAIGTVHLPTTLAVAALAVLSAACTLVTHHLKSQPVRLGAAGWALFGLTLIALLQAVPLPSGLVHLLGGSMGTWLDFAYGSLPGEASSWATFSLAPGQSVQGALGLMAALGVFITTSHQFRDRAPFARGLWTAPLLGVGLVLIGLIQRGIGSSARGFVYTPSDMEVTPLMAATFVNPDHLGALLAILAMATLGMSLSRDFQEWRSHLVVLFVIISAGLGLTLSASAAFAWGFGLITLLILTLRSRMPRGLLRLVAPPAVIVAVGVVLYGVWQGLGEQLAFLRTIQHLTWFDPALPQGHGWTLLTEGSFLTGTGWGTFGDAAAAAGLDLPVNYAFVGNGFLQVMLDFGAPAGLLAIGALATPVFVVGQRQWWRPGDSPVVLGLIASMASLAFIAATGFATSIPGTFIPAALLLGLLVGRDRRYIHSRTPRKRRSDDPEPITSPLKTALSRIAPVAPAAAVLLLALLVLPLAPGAIRDAQGVWSESLRAVASQPAPLPEEVERVSRDALARRPMAGRLHLMIAVAHRAAGDEALSIKALERAIHLDGDNPAPRLLMARARIEQGRRADAIAAYKEAMARAVHTQGRGRDAVATELARVIEEPDELLKVMPPDAPEVWSLVLRALLARAPQKALDAAKMLEAAQPKENPNAELVKTARLIQAKALLSLGQRAEARTMARAMISPGPGPSGAYQILVRLDADDGALRSALAVAEAGLKQHPDDLELRFRVAEILIDIHSDANADDATSGTWLARMETLTDELRPYALRRNGPRHRFYMLSSRFLASQGRRPLAIRDLRKASQADPSAPEPMIMLAKLLRSEQRDTEALEIYRDMIARWPDHPEQARWEHEAAVLKLDQEEIQKRWSWPGDTSPPPTPSDTRSASP